MSSSCRASERDPVALVESCQRSLLWLLQSHQREPLRRCWIDHPYEEEERTRLEDELLPASGAVGAVSRRSSLRWRALDRRRGTLRGPELLAPWFPSPFLFTPTTGRAGSER
jgi:hypothetical protein